MKNICFRCGVIRYKKKCVSPTPGTFQPPASYAITEEEGSSLLDLCGSSEPHKSSKTPCLEVRNDGESLGQINKGMLIAFRKLQQPQTAA